MPIPNLGRGGLPVYAPSSSSATATNGSRNVSFTGTALVTTDATTGAATYSAGVGDSFVVSGIGAKLIESITDATHLVLVEPWTYATQTSSVNWYIIRNSVPAFGYTAKAIQDVLSVGTDATPAQSITVDDGTARIKLSSNSGSPGLLVGPTGGPLVPGIIFTSSGVASFPNGVILPAVSTKLYTYNFVTTPSLPATFSLTRSTVANYINASLTRTSAAINAARFEPGGLLIEAVNTNFDPNSEISTGWTPQASVITTSGVLGADNSTAMLQIKANSGVTTPGVAFYISGVSTGASHSVFSFDAKAGTLPYISAGFFSGSGSTANVVFNLNTGTITQTGNQGGVVGTGSIRALRSGIYRCSMNINTGGGTYMIHLAPQATGNTFDAFSNVAWVGSTAGTETVFVGAKSIIKNDAFQSHIKTTGSTLQRTDDVLAATSSIITGSSTLISYLAAGPSVWEFTDIAAGTTGRWQYGGGGFNFPKDQLYRSFAVYPSGTDTSPFLTVGGPY